MISRVIRPNTDVLTGYNARRGMFEVFGVSVLSVEKRVKILSTSTPVIVNYAVKRGEQVFIEYGFEKATGSLK